MEYFSKDYNENELRILNAIKDGTLKQLHMQKPTLWIKARKSLVIESIKKGVFPEIIRFEYKDDEEVINQFNQEIEARLPIGNLDVDELDFYLNERRKRIDYFNECSKKVLYESNGEKLDRRVPKTDSMLNLYNNAFEDMWYSMSKAAEIIAGENQYSLENER